MKRLLLFLAPLPALLVAQYTPKIPASAPTDADLFVASYRAVCTLQAPGMTDIATTLDCDAGKGSLFAINNLIVVESEVMLVTGIATDTLTVTRAQQGTSAAAHSAGLTVTNITHPAYINNRGEEIKAIGSWFASYWDDGTNKLTFAALPTGSTSSTVAAGDHTHSASSITTGTLPAGQLPQFTGGDATTASAGSVNISVGRVAGVSYGTNPATHSVPVVTGTNATTYKALPDCNATFSHLAYEQDTLDFGCVSIPSAGPITDGYLSAADYSTFATGISTAHTQNTDTGTTATCFQLDNDATGPKLCHDGSGGWQLKKSDDTVLMAVDANGVMTLGTGAPWNLTGLTDDAAPGAPGTANQFTAYVDRSDGFLKLHFNGAGGPKTVLYSDGSAASLTGFPTLNQDTTGTAAKVTVGASPTVDAAGKIAIDTTSDQVRVYGSAERVIPTLQERSFVIAAPADTDDINLMKAPYGMTIVAINAIVQGTTSVTGQLQECNSTGASCADLDSDIVADADGAADDGTLTDSAIASGAWLRWKTTSVSGTPTFLTVTFTFRVVAD